jgi:hypothetical protein
MLANVAGGIRDWLLNNAGCTTRYEGCVLQEPGVSGSGPLHKFTDLTF